MWLQALAQLDEKARDYEAATRHFELASQVSPKDLHVWQVRPFQVAASRFTVAAGGELLLGYA